jgi:hypothetical protein
MYIFEFAQLGMALVIDMVPPILNGRFKEVTRNYILASEWYFRRQTVKSLFLVELIT